MANRDSADHAFIDITIEPSALRGWSMFLLVGMVIVLGLIGAAVSPLEKDHPILLTPARLAVKHYLNATEDWITGLENIERRLTALELDVAPRPTTLPLTEAQPMAVTATIQLTTPIPTHIDLPLEPPLPSLGQPANLPGNLYERAQQAEQVVQELQAIDRQMQQIETPDTLNGLHVLAQTTWQHFAEWSAAVLDAVGAPTPENLDALPSARQAAQASLEGWRTILQTQRGAAP